MEAAQVMREISLREYQRSPAHTLAAGERDMLKAVLPSTTIETAAGAEGIYHLTPGSVVGAVEVGALSVLIAPKIGIPNLLSLSCYAISRVRFGTEEFEYPKEYALPDVLAMALATQARRAFSSGLLHGYRPEEQALLTVRGRINFEEQLRRRFDTHPAARGTAIRRVHRRHPGQPAAEGRRIPVGPHALEVSEGA